MDSLMQEIAEICVLFSGGTRVKKIREAIVKYLSCDCGLALGRGVCPECDRDE